MAATKDLAEILTLIDPEKYKSIITRAANNGYHDHKHGKIPGHPEYGDCLCPKVQLLEDLSEFPELAHIVKKVIDGDYDEMADEQDAEEIRGWLIEDGAPDGMFNELKIKLPTAAERQLKRAINN